MAVDPTWSKLAWTVRKSARIKTFCEDIAKWDMKSCVDLSAADGAVVLLAANTIAEEFSEVPEGDVATVRVAVRNILQCLLANTGAANRAIFFKVLEAVDVGQKFLSFADKELCQQLVEEAYGSKELETAPAEKAAPEKKEGDEEEAAAKGNEEEDSKKATPEEAAPEGTTPEGNKQEVVEKTSREGAPLEEAVPKKKDKDAEEARHEEASPKPQEVAGAKKLFAKLSSGLVKDVSTPPSTQDAALLLDTQFWGESLSAAAAVSMCTDMAGFDAVRVNKVEELSTSLLAPHSSAEKGTNLTDMHRKLNLLSQSVESALVLFEIPSVWDTSCQSSMDQLKELIVLCSHAAISSAYTTNYLSRLRPSQSATGAAAAGEKQQPKTFADLLAALSSTAPPQPASASIQACVGVAGCIIKTALKACDGTTREPNSAQQDSFPDQVLRNIRFLVMHCLFQGLYPAVCRQGQLNETPKHVRFSSSMCEMLQCSVQLLSWLLDDISKETVEEGPCSLVWDQFSLLGQYSCQSHLSCLNHCVPVVDMLLGVAENSCKKALLQPHVMLFTPTAPAAEGSSSSAGGPPEGASTLPPLPAKRGKPPSQKSMNVVIQQILQSAVADASSAPPEEGEEGGEAGGEQEEEERNAAGEDREESGSAYSSCSSEEGEEVYVLFNEDDSAHEDVGASYGFMDSPLYEPPVPPTDQVTPPPVIPEAPPLPPKRKNQNQRPLPPLPRGDDGKVMKLGDSQDPVQRRIPFLKLASCAVECFQGKLVSSGHTTLQAFLRSHFSVESVQCLGRLVQCIDSNKNKAVGKMAECVTVKEDVVGLTNELILRGVFSQSSLEDAFLVELGLKDVGGEWPLNVPSCTLSVLARLLVWRLGNLESGNDSLSVDIWQRLLSTLESNACQSGFLPPKQDLSVVHCQLLTFIFHHFTKETRTSLFRACITGVIRAAQARRAGANTSLLAVARLLTVMDYVVFQFSGENTQHFEQLTEQVYHNLLSPTCLSLPEDTVKYYPGTIEGDYTRVLLKIMQQNSNQPTDMMRPRFFNLRPVKMRTLGEEPPEEEDSAFAEVCHSILLGYQGPTGQDYTMFHQSIVHIFGSVLQSGGGHFEGLSFHRVLYATAARQCVDLCQHLLTALPPSGAFLQQFFTDEGFPMDTPDGAASFLVLLRFLSMLRSQALDSGDLLEALEQSGSSSDDSEELVGRVFSLTASNDFFVPLALQHLKKILTLPDDRLPCEITLIAIDLLVTMVEHEVAPFMTAPKEVVPKRRKARRRKKGSMDTKQESGGAKDAKEAAGKEEGVEGTDSVEPKGKRAIKRKPTPADSGVERVPDFVSEAVPIISQLLSKVMSYTDLYVIHGESTLEDKPRPDDPLHEDLEQMKDVYALMLRVGQTPKGWQKFFRDELPVALQERLATWLESLEVSKEDENDSKFIEPGSLLSRILIKHLIAFAGYRPFSCVRSMKSVVMSTTRLMQDLCTLCDVEMIDEVFTRLIPVGCGKTAEKLHIIDPSLDTSSAEGTPNMIHIASACLSTAHQLVHHPALRHSRLLGSVVEDAIKLVSDIVEDSSLWPALVVLPTTPYPTDITSLILATAYDNVQPGVVSEGLRLLMRIIQLPDKTAHPSTLMLYEQLANLTTQPEELVREWLRRVVVGPGDEGAVNTDNLTLFSAITMGLTQEESGTDVEALRCILHHLISLGPQVLETVGKNRSFLMFKPFWSTCFTLASSDALNEHITLLRAAAQWLSTSVEMVPSGPEDGDNANSPALVILEYLLLVSSALYLTLDQEQYASHHSLVSDKALTLTDSEQDLEESLTGEEEEGSDDEGLNSKLCSFTVTQKTYIHQYWYHCYTCGLAENTGVCSVCAKVCHKDHELAYSKYGAFFCDCGARGEAHCKALTPRAPDPSAKKKKPRPAIMAKRSEAKEAKTDKALPLEEKSKEPAIPSAVVKLSQQIEDSKEALKEFFESSNLAAQALDLLSRLKPAVMRESRDLLTCSGLALAQQALCDLHYKEKRVEHVETLMAAILGSPEGAFENVKLNFSGDQGQVMKQLLSSFAIHRVAMCCVSGGQGKKQHLAVSHDKGKFAILQLSALLKQTDSNKRKLTLTRLTTMTLPFTVLSLAVNPSYDSYLAMCGLKECAVTCFNSSGQAVERLTLHPSVDYTGYIVKCIWMPGSRSELAVVSDTFVKIYDLAVDVICPQYCFIVMSGKVKDATFVVNKQEKHLVVMMSSGVMYSQPVVPECSAADGPVYLVRELTVGHDQVEVGTDGVICGGGASVYFSHSLQLLLFSYMNGKTFASHLSTDATQLEKLFYIPLKGVPSASSGGDNAESGPASGTGSTPGKSVASASLVQWTEVPHFPGMICSLSQATSTPVVLFFRPEVIQVHELKALSSKSKVQGMVAMHQVQGDGAAEAAKTTLVLLSEDGSLRIYLASNTSETKYWVQPQFQASSPLAALQPRGRRRAKEGPKGDHIKFSIDFFEHCVPLTSGDVEFGGTDLLHVYTTSQVKTRLNTNGMYICNTRPSGFTIEVTNNQWKTSVFAGVRVLLGNKPPDRCPSYIEVFGRRLPCNMGGNTPRWQDIPFTKEESLQAEKTLKIKFGPSIDPSGISFVDSIRLYSKAKSVVGWPEGPSEVSPTQSNGSDTQQAGEMSPLEESAETGALPTTVKSLSGLDRMACNSLSLLANCCSCIEVPKQLKSSCFDMSRDLLTVSLPPTVQYHCRYLMSSVVKGREEFHSHADTALLSYVVQALYNSVSDPELFQRLLLALLTVSKSHPQNLIQLLDEDRLREFRSAKRTPPPGDTVVEGEGKDKGEEEKEREHPSTTPDLDQDFLTKLNTVFWELIAQTPATPAVTSVATPVLLGVDLVVMTMVEVMWAFVASGQVSVQVIMPHLVRMLQSQEAKISSTCMRTLIFLVKPAPKKAPPVQTTAKEATDGSKEGDKEGEGTEQEGEDGQEVDGEQPPAEGEEEAAPGQAEEQGENQDMWDSLLTVLPQQWHQALNLLRIEFQTPAEAMEHILTNPQQFMAAMEGVVPGFDDDALMNIALALSSQEQPVQAPFPEELEPTVADPGLESSGSNDSLSGPVPPELAIADAQVAQPDELEEEEAELEEDDLQQREQEQQQQQLESSSSSPGTLTPPGTGEGGARKLQQRNERKKGSGEDEGSSGGDSSADEEQEEDAALGDVDLDQTITDGQSAAPDDQMPDASETPESSQDEGPMDAARQSRISLLRELVDILPSLTDKGGVGIIPLMQVVLALCTHLDLSGRERKVLAEVLQKCFKAVNFATQDITSLTERTPQHEVQLILLRFISILLGYRKKDKHKDTKLPEVINARLLSVYTAKLLLKDTSCMEFCLSLLQALLKNQSSLIPAEDSASSAATMKMPPPSLSSDLAPFFQRDYVKANADDVLRAFPRMLTDMALTLPAELKKIGENSKKLKKPMFGPEWTATLCEFLNNAGHLATMAKKPLKKLLVSICGSKDEYRRVRDLHYFGKQIEDIKALCFSHNFPSGGIAGPLLLPHATLLQLISHMKEVCDRVTLRPANWQAFCSDNDGTLALLSRCVLFLNEGVSPFLLKLLYIGVSGHPLKANDKGVPNSEVKPGEYPEVSFRLTAQLMSFLSSQDLLRHLVVRFLLQSNSTETRWQTHALLYSIFHTSQPEHKICLMDTLWKLWPEMAAYGHRAAQFVDILGYVTVSSRDLLAQRPELKRTVCQQAIGQLSGLNGLLARHPSAHIYTQLASLVNFDGYYLESEPCSVCNNPELPNSNMKLMAMKSEVRYSPNAMFVKLKGSFAISQFTITIADIKKSKMVRVVNLYYSNRTVQNAIELKNKRSIWLKAQSATLSSGQTEVKFDFPLPITACNIVLEFAEFYTNMQASPEVLHCPRCGASVPAHPGVCGQCGENVFQCHKCRSINYDEKDPFLCNSCGISKYAKFDYSMVGKECTSVDPIESDEDRAKTLSNISTLLERANSVYERLVEHRHTLDKLLSQVSSSSDSLPTSSPPVLTVVPTGSRGAARYIMVSEGHATSGATEGMVNKSIQEVAVCYSRNCKATYRELSNLICSVMASRQEVAEYDQKKLEASQMEGIPVSPSPTPTLNWTEEQCSERPQQKNCYGCASAAVGHCVTLLKALALSSETRSLLVEAGLIGQLVHHNQRGSNSVTQHNVQDLLCLLTKNDLEATQELSRCILSRVMSVVDNHHLSPNIASAVQPEVNLLLATLTIKDRCWEHRLRTVVTLFQKTRRHSNPVVVEAVALPCLTVLKNLTNPSSVRPPPAKEVEEAAVPVEEVGEKPKGPPSPAPCPLSRPITVDVGAWLREDPSNTFSSWVEKAKEEKRRLSGQTAEEQRAEMLQAKYTRLWKARMHKFSTARTQEHHASWLRSMLFNPSSRAARLAACTVVRSLLTQQGSNSRRVWTVLDMLCSYLPDVSVAGEKAAEFLGLFKSLTTDDASKMYLASKGILQTIGELLSAEIKALTRLERSTLSADVAQGFSLLMLVQLLKSFLAVEPIKEAHKGRLVGVVLHSYLGLRCLVVQRTKKIEDAEALLLKILEDLTSGTEEEKKKFMAECVAILGNFSSSDLLTPVFVFERLCNMILPEKSKEAVFFLQLDKDPQQEEFLQGKMQGNPYKCTDPGLGPLMRDIKNKICTDCELVALLEDDSGMELLVCNKIISLDLPVADVYKKVWLTQATPASHPQINHCMRVVYRMRGLMGDATEDIIETLDSGSSENVDEEEIYHMADTMSECGGLEAALTRLARVQDVSRGHQLLMVVLKFLSSCLKLKVNRQYAIQPHLNTLNTLLAVLNRALRFEQDHSDGVGASIAEKVLSVMGSVLLEASNSQTVIIRQSSMGGESAVPELALDEQSQLGQLLKHIETPFVQSNPSIRKALMRVLPYLTFGNVGSMNVLLDYFKPSLDFDRYDAESSTEGTLYLDCFIAVASGIGSDVSGAKLKDLMIDQGLVKLCVDYILTHVPQATSFSANFESHEWRECLARPSLPYVLQILTGLCQNHHSTQRLLVDVTPQLHVLEQVSSTEHIGSMTEALLKVLDEDGVVAKVEEARRATRHEKAERAMAVREKMLHEFGMKVNAKGQVIAQSQVMKDLEKTVKIEEEKGLTCCICREGYENEPKKLLGVYTFTKRCSVDEFERKPRKTQGFCTVTHFNVIHYDCHTSAVMTARGRNEWESAMLQNSNTRCNGILPIWGPEVSESAFASCLARHNSYVREATNHYDASYAAWIHDIKSLLLRFAQERSFSSESGGGGPQSNVHMVPYLLHVALYVLNTTRLYASEERALTAFVTSPEDAWVAAAYELEGAYYMLVSSLAVFNYPQWKEHRMAFLRRLLVTAHARHISPSHITGLPAESASLDYSVYKPCLVLFGLVDHFQGRLKKKLEASGEGLPEALLDYIRQNTSGLSSVCDKVLTAYQEELLTAESFDEMVDVLDLLGDIPDPSEFLSSLIASVTA